MEVERALQADHSDYMRIIADFDDEDSARRVHRELTLYLDTLLSRLEAANSGAPIPPLDASVGIGDQRTDPCPPATGGRPDTEPSGCPPAETHGQADADLILDDWCRDDVRVALSDNVVAIRVYTAGYGIDHMEQWLSERGGAADVEVEGYEYDFILLDFALEELQASPDAEGAPGVRAEDGHSSTP